MEPNQSLEVEIIYTIMLILQGNIKIKITWFIDSPIPPAHDTPFCTKHFPWSSLLKQVVSIDLLICQKPQKGLHFWWSFGFPNEIYKNKRNWIGQSRDKIKEEANQERSQGSQDQISHQEKWVTNRHRQKQPLDKLVPQFLNKRGYDENWSSKI